MHDKSIYKTRQALRESESVIPQEVDAALANARRRAVHAAESAQSTSNGVSLLGIRHWSRQAWGLAATAATVGAVAIGLNIAERTTIDQNLNRLASIDQKMIAGPLPVQAYLDPGFLVYQESFLDQNAKESSGGATVSFLEKVADMGSRWSAESLFPGFKGIQPGPTWSKLSVNQREALAPLESLWSDMEAHRRQKWIRIADRFHLLSPEQQSLAQARMQEWVSMPAVDRRQARAVFDGVKEVIPEDVRVMKWNEYQKLTPKERARLVELAQLRTTPTPTDDSVINVNNSGNITGAAPAVADMSSPTPRSALSRHADKPLASQ
jgi:hypothetical protein